MRNVYLADELYDTYMLELTRGIGQTGTLKAGVTKWLRAGSDIGLRDGLTQISAWTGSAWRLSCRNEERAKVKNWDFTNIFCNILPAVKAAGITDKQIDTILVDNPARLFG